MHSGTLLYALIVKITNTETFIDKVSDSCNVTQRIETILHQMLLGRLLHVSLE